MSLLLIFAAYAVGWCVTAVQLVRYFLRTEHNPDTGDKVFFVGWSMIAALFWPFVLPGMVIWRLATKDFHERDPRSPEA